MTAAFDHTYEYAYSSGIRAIDNKQHLALATSSPNHLQPYFFDGQVRSPKLFGDMLITLSDVVRTHFYLPRPALLDPVLTSNEQLLRLEGFSGCCGVYARVDLPSDFFEGECHGKGTTNVDFNAPMRNALMRLRDSEKVEFAVGKQEVALTTSHESTIEKKVKLPLRWIKGFSEVQAYQPRLTLVMEVSAADGLQFIRSLPKTSAPKQPSYAVSRGRGIRLTQRPQKGAVKISGTHRVRVIEALMHKATSLRVWSDQEGETSAWEVCFPIGSFFLMISPEVYRSFSGEGQVLSGLGQSINEAALSKVRAQLTWQSEVNPIAIAELTQLPIAEVDQALLVLGSRGLAGFDVATGHYFHRELPFELEKVDELQPRLKGARNLIEQGKVTAIRANGQNQENASKTIKEYEISGSDVNHRVRLSEEGDHCTCVWFSKYQGKRGPCKHILAAQIDAENTAKG
ncbi:SWIM zinc finger family protein [Pleionea litopenaei]|uniref:SWIM zinc finger family protein n=1 Tax=Pleionea litopenaei TaxID=3070815 RepID=A0AA51RSZ0_9GAMM|nr:SWIM zinc finger family protein [Pleionea sp. HL-JVS1]WMS87046.1 SWIM zinc finger family protein [Pleionea sp. HL-JVS1]